MDGLLPGTWAFIWRIEARWAGPTRVAGGGGIEWEPTRPGTPGRVGAGQPGGRQRIV